MQTYYGDLNTDDDNGHQAEQLGTKVLPHFGSWLVGSVNPALVSKLNGFEGIFWTHQPDRS